jgi:hypothetical protein
MKIYALLIGVITGILIIWHFKRRKLEYSQLPYPILLATFPVYYFAFALFASDFNALYKEIGISIVFFLLVYFAIKVNRKMSALLVALGCIVHGVYDIYHDLLFINNGTPLWWPEFCGSIDLILGAYLIYFSKTIPSKVFTVERKGAET